MVAPAPLFDRPIALVGMPGVGKSRVGTLLARRLGLSFSDTDEEVVRQTGRSVDEWFVGEGQGAFREREREAIARSTGSGPLVIATGGGAMIQPATRQLLLSRTVTIWLQASPVALVRRLGGAPPRPLLTGDELLEKLEAMSRERQPFYEQADIHLDTDILGPAAAAEAAARALAAWTADHA